MRVGKFKVYATESGAIVDGPNPDAPRGSYLIVTMQENGSVTVEFDPNLMSDIDAEYHQYLNRLPLGDFIVAMLAAREFAIG